MTASLLPVRWRGALHFMPVCRSDAQVEETVARWPERVVDLVNVFEHKSPSSLRGRAHLVGVVLKKAGERPLTIEVGEERLDALRASMTPEALKDEEAMRVRLSDALQQLERAEPITISAREQLAPSEPVPDEEAVG